MLLAPVAPAAAPLLASLPNNDLAAASVGDLIAPSQTPAHAQPTAGEIAIANAINAFAQDLYPLLQKEFAGSNLTFSPLSLATALAMAYAGARGETAVQMANVLHLSDSTATHSDFGSLLADLNGAEQGSNDQLHVADALWGQIGYAFKDQFLNLVQSNYGGGLQQVDYNDAAAAVKTINDWVANETNRKIQHLLDPTAVNAWTKLVLTNAVYFNGQWAEPFDPRATHDAAFTLASQDRVMTPTMHQTGYFPYMESDGYQVLELPYADGRLSMVLMLPANGTGGNALPVDLNQWLSGLSLKEVQVSLPKFKMTTMDDLGDSLQALGMVDAFSGAAADFSGIADRGLFITYVIQQAMIDVNETGTEAAAATALGFAGAAPGQLPIQFNADHPFQFLIRDNVTGSILFMGQVTNPAPAGTPVLPPDHTVVQPVTPQPVPPTPVVPQPIVPEPVLPQPVGPQPVAPQPVTPQPVAPQPAAPQPVAVETAEADPVASDLGSYSPVLSQSVGPMALVSEYSASDVPGQLAQAATDALHRDTAITWLYANGSSESASLRSGSPREDAALESDEAAANVAGQQPEVLAGAETPAFWAAAVDRVNLLRDDRDDLAAAALGSLTALKPLAVLPEINAATPVALLPEEVDQGANAAVPESE